MVDLPHLAPKNVLTKAPAGHAHAKTDWTSLALDAARGGDYRNAVDLFVTAISHDRRNAGLRYNLAIVLERHGEIDDAAVSLTDALRLKPGMPEAAQRLSRLLSTYIIAEPERLDAAGLLSALSVQDVEADSIGQMAITILKLGGPLSEALQNGGWSDWESTAEALIGPRTAALLKDTLFLRALACHANQDVELEHLLVALRRAFLRLSPERFGDKAVVACAIALAQQCLHNEHVFEIASDEQIEVEALQQRLQLSAKLSHDDIKAVLVSLMYAPPQDVFATLPDPAKLTAMKPKALRTFILPLMKRQKSEADTARAIRRAGALTDDTSHKVAAQYEDRPYPRWSTCRAPQEGALTKVLERFFTPRRVAFMSQRFDVLIAGCGTGRHAIEATIGYGPNADVSAIDLSRQSLAYATLEARDRGLRNVSFQQADLLDPTACAQLYDIIECVGVLHHLERPLDGLRALEKRLKPGGLMQLAVYSAVSREELSELRFEDNYPGTDCNENAARRYRAELRDRTADETGGELTNSADFWSLSGFRDLVLHVSEQQLTLPEIKAALDELGLIFRGFTLHPQQVAEFKAAYPTTNQAGDLADWWEWEQENPRLFDGMYNFWVEKPYGE